MTAAGAARDGASAALLRRALSPVEPRDRLAERRFLLEATSVVDGRARHAAASARAAAEMAADRAAAQRSAGVIRARRGFAAKSGGGGRESASGDAAEGAESVAQEEQVSVEANIVWLPLRNSGERWQFSLGTVLVGSRRVSSPIRRKAGSEVKDDYWAVCAAHRNAAAGGQRRVAAERSSSSKAPSLAASDASDSSPSAARSRGEKVSSQSSTVGLLSGRYLQNCDNGELLYVLRDARGGGMVHLQWVGPPLDEERRDRETINIICQEEGLATFSWPAMVDSIVHCERVFRRQDGQTPPVTHPSGPLDFSTVQRNMATYVGPATGAYAMSRMDGDECTCEGESDGAAGAKAGVAGNAPWRAIVRHEHPCMPGTTAPTFRSLVNGVEGQEARSMRELLVATLVQEQLKSVSATAWLPLMRRRTTTGSTRLFGPAMPLLADKENKHENGMEVDISRVSPERVAQPEKDVAVFMDAILCLDQGLSKREHRERLVAGDDGPVCASKAVERVEEQAKRGVDVLLVEEEPERMKHQNPIVVSEAPRKRRRSLGIQDITHPTPSSPTLAVSDICRPGLGSEPTRWSSVSKESRSPGIVPTTAARKVDLLLKRKQTQWPGDYEEVEDVGDQQAMRRLPPLPTNVPPPRKRRRVHDALHVAHADAFASGTTGHLARGVTQPHDSVRLPPLRALDAQPVLTSSPPRRGRSQSPFSHHLHPPEGSRSDVGRKSDPPPPPTNSGASSRRLRSESRPDIIPGRHGEDLVRGRLAYCNTRRPSEPSDSVSHPQPRVVFPETPAPSSVPAVESLPQAGPKLRDGNGFSFCANVMSWESPPLSRVEVHPSREGAGGDRPELRSEDFATPGSAAPSLEHNVEMERLDAAVEPVGRPGIRPGRGSSLSNYAFHSGWAHQNYAPMAQHDERVAGFNTIGGGYNMRVQGGYFEHDGFPQYLAYAKAPGSEIPVEAWSQKAWHPGMQHGAQTGAQDCGLPTIDGTRHADVNACSRGRYDHMLARHFQHQQSYTAPSKISSDSFRRTAPFIDQYQSADCPESLRQSQFCDSARSALVTAPEASVRAPFAGVVSEPQQRREDCHQLQMRTEYAAGSSPPGCWSGHTSGMEGLTRYVDRSRPEVPVEKYCGPSEAHVNDLRKRAVGSTGVDGNALRREPTTTTAISDSNAAWSDSRTVGARMPAGHPLAARAWPSGKAAANGVAGVSPRAPRTRLSGETAALRRKASNIASAKRSNARKKAAYEQLVRDLELAKASLAMLTERRKVLRAENRRLKALKRSIAKK